MATRRKSHAGSGRAPAADAEAGLLTPETIRGIVERSLASWDVDGRRVVAVIPDHTRTCPLPRLFRLLADGLAPRVRSLDFLVALGTHPRMSEEDMLRLVGLTAGDYRDRYAMCGFHNHEWKNPSQLATVGTLSADEVASMTRGLFRMDVNVTCNRRILDADRVLIVGPVFPHEVVGFSGGNKYLFPGVAGQEIIDFFHWLGAVITNPEIIGRKRTPVRAVVDRVAGFVRVERRAFCMVVKGQMPGVPGEPGLAGLFFGRPEEAWSEAADLSARTHVIYTHRQFKTILSCAPRMYDDLWTGGKCMYKVEPVVAPGGSVIIYAPHITDISVSHGAILEQIGYHTRDFFLKQWDCYKHYPWGVLAHSTHVKGFGTYEHGVEKPRADVILATGIPEALCRKINLGYLDPASVRISDYEGREPEGILCIPKAGEMLYRPEP